MSNSCPEIWAWWPLLIPPGVDDEYYAAQEKTLAAWAKHINDEVMDAFVKELIAKDAKP